MRGQVDPLDHWPVWTNFLWFEHMNTLKKHLKFYKNMILTRQPAPLASHWRSICKALEHTGFYSAAQEACLPQ